MRYVSWAAFYEGSSDALYLDVLLPRIINDLVAREGTDLVEVPEAPALKLGENGRAVNAVAAEACASKEAFDVIFIHSDTGGRGLERTLACRSESYCGAMAEICEWPSSRCITITPRHETEAWLLSDGAAVTAALGYNGSPADIGLPADAAAAERLANPKLVLRSAIEEVAGRRRGESVDRLFPAIAQKQQLHMLRAAKSYLAFEEQLRNCLREMQCIK